MTVLAPRTRDKSLSALAAAGITLALGYAFTLAFGLRPFAPPQPPIQLIGLLPEPPRPEQVVERHAVSHRKEGKASPPNLRATPTEIVAPPPVVPPQQPPMAAPIAGVGAAPSAGAADVPGPGTGAGGIGNGTGSGGAGNGDGDGGDMPPRWLRGRLKDSDYPPGAAAEGIGGMVSVRYTVWTDGRVTDCEITRSSGNRELDEATCRLIMQRYRFDPSRDSRGRPVPSLVAENHEWIPRD